MASTDPDGTATPPRSAATGATPSDDHSLAVDRLARGAAVAHVLGYPTRWFRDRVDFSDPHLEYRRLFSELFGTFLLVLVAVGGGAVNARFGGEVIPLAAQVTAPGLMVASIILFMGSVSGAHLNPGVSVAFALRGDFPWRRVPSYIVAQLIGAALATLVLVGLLGSQGTAGLTLPGAGISPMTAMLWEALLTTGLVSVILGTSSGAQNLGPIAAIGVGSYIILAGLWGAPVSGASMNSARSLGPAVVLGDLSTWWVYVVGPFLGAFVAVAFAWILRGSGGGVAGRRAAQGGMGMMWLPGAIDDLADKEATRVEHSASAHPHRATRGGGSAGS